MITSDNKNDAKLTTAIVVDDDHDIVDSFCEYLELKNIHVLGRGYNGKDAVDLYQRLSPNVVFLDIMMPDYTGFYALEKIKRINPDARIVIVTADETEETENKLVELGASYIAYKPINFSGKVVVFTPDDKEISDVSYAEFLAQNIEKNGDKKE